MNALIFCAIFTAGVLSFAGISWLLWGRRPETDTVKPKAEAEVQAKGGLTALAEIRAKLQAVTATVQETHEETVRMFLIRSEMLVPRFEVYKSVRIALRDVTPFSVALDNDHPVIFEDPTVRHDLQSLLLKQVRAQG